MKPLSKRLLGSLFPICLAFLAPPPALSQHFPADDNLRAMLKYLVEDGEAVGVIFGVLEADGSTRVVSYGRAGPDARPVGSQTVFETASVGKIFKGTLLADAADREAPHSKETADEKTSA